MTRLFSDLKPWLFVVGFWAIFTLARVQAEDWTTTDGKSYENVSVVKVEDDAVTITHKSGGALVPLEKLSSDLQKRFHYDPVKAKIAAAARAKREAADEKALADEKARLDKVKQQQQIDAARAQERAQKSIEQQQGT